MEYWGNFDDDLARVVGLEDTTILPTDIDYVFGNKDGKLSLPEFERFLAHFGFAKVASCANTADMVRVAIFGKVIDGSTVVTHAARSAWWDIGDGQWWDSQIGLENVIRHRLNDLTGATYGEVLECYGKQR